MPPQSNPTPPFAPMNTQSNNTLMAVFAYLGILIIIPFVTDAKNDPFVKFHLKQGLVLVILEVVIVIVGSLPVLSWVLAPLLTLASIILSIVGIINAVTGKQNKLPLVGSIGDKFNF